MAVTDIRFSRHLPARVLLLALALLLAPWQAIASVLPADRADVMYHQYDGGGMTIDGPSVLVRKAVRDDLSLSANYYVDQVSSASIDVITTGASKYSEERTEFTVSGDYLLNKTIISGGYTGSSENDYEANTYYFGIAQDFFGDLSTLSLNYSYGADDVFNATDEAFEDKVRRQNYQFSWSQVMTKNLVMNFNYNIITDEGYLNNPYRSVRFLNNDEDPSQGYSFQPELYPRTRTSHAVAARGRYFLPYRAAFSFEYRRFNDTWEVNAYNLQIGYTHPIRENWTLDVKYRFYSQDEAEFYSDLFPEINFQNYLARDKELSEFTSDNFGIGLGYEFKPAWASWVEKASANIALDFMEFDYSNFRDLRVQGVPAGSEPMYNFDATVTRIFISAWF